MKSCNCLLLINNKKSELVEYYYLNSKDKIKDKLFVKYFEIEKIRNKKYELYVLWM